ncbi:MAG: Eco57I restriction-modification methylase domain-containing protein [Salinivirgaceae bacterium]|jgi:type I restriction-modification system DNA methylase subunit|nr:N-6 DNA methylase [Bacteroidales bacterium]HPW65871.1 N-6 DNA methylase [Salinivirgaceae bacterium]HQA76639.1 N-6 DNA methylase [Salinivirgaceae bacterium]
MAFFQQTVLNKYLRNLNSENILTNYEVFKKTFHNPEIQENIRQSNEEQYQGGFLNDLFVNVLGYKLNPQENFNLTTEFKNVKDSKKADGAILINNKVKAVIELKGTNTIDLDKVEDQAFGYKNNQPDCTYVIISNFEKLRFYIDNAIEHIEFNLFALTEEQFKILWLCLAYENIADDLPKKIKTASISQEDEITKKLYEDYSQFKQELFRNIVKLNPEHDELELFKKSQKLLDRFLFIFFAEDRNLLPPNSMRKILHQWKQLQELDAYIPLYDRFKLYFKYMNTGHKGKNDDVYAYNGGLFKPDTILDSIIIDDAVLHEHTLKLSNYDYASEVDVNILGHIFEHSLNEIEEIKANLEGKEVDKNKTKRKKDGIYYTPKYITKYIVENTVGKLCDEKKQELGIVEEDYITDRKRNTSTKKTLLNKLELYRAWLLKLTICDPACGSGAFLNQALDFLIKEHRYIDELIAKVTGASIVFGDIEISILENNLFGVDLNEESVEIAKLSLWLRTARPQRKLNDLNDNIKCGNSLIDDPEVAGDKAFNWEAEFPQVFAEGGFDVVIGNPPYVRGRELEEKERRYLDKYGIASNDTAILFIKIGKSLINTKGVLSYIVPKSLLYASNWDVIRYEIYKHLYMVIDCGKVWNEVLLEQVIFALSHCYSKEYKTGFRFENTIQELDFVDNKYVEIFNFLPARETSKTLSIAKKMLNSSTSLNSAYKNIAGVPNQKHITSYGDYNMIGGAEFNRFEIYKFKGKIDKKWVQTDNAFIKENTLIVQNIIAHILYPVEHIKITACIPSKEHINVTTIANTVNQLSTELEISNKFTWCIINSKLINWYVFHFVFAMAIRTMHFYNPISEKTPFKYKDIDQQPFIDKADQMLSLNKSLQEILQKFTRMLERRFEIDKIPNRLQEWHTLSFNEFLNELRKRKVKLSLAQETEWEDYFHAEKEKATTIAEQISATDREIDQMVYKLYDLTDEEIEIVEKG